ncbi:hypothetical protein [Nocardia coffeae]|nr:hypothetical protein [Nocardia coffeae]
MLLVTVGAVLVASVVIAAGAGWSTVAAVWWFERRTLPPEVLDD